MITLVDAEQPAYLMAHVLWVTPLARRPLRLRRLRHVIVEVTMFVADVFTTLKRGSTRRFAAAWASAVGRLTRRYSGGMFWLSRKKLSGSYFRFSALSRSYFSAP